MVQKSEPRRRGRPRAYDPERALRDARDAFWKAGYAATSLDELSAAMSMNRPSLYAAFGDKRALYLATLQRYRDEARAQLAERLRGARALGEELRGVYAFALASYLAGPEPRGCFLIGTAVTEANGDSEVRSVLAAALGEIEAAFAARFRLARERGEVAQGAEPAALARLAAATLYSLAVHARAGVPRPMLDSIAEAAVGLLCGPPAPSSRGAGKRGKRGSGKEICTPG